MPRGDGTGPEGRGPTGGGFGYCTAYEQPGYGFAPFGRGRGAGRHGRRHRNIYRATGLRRWQRPPYAPESAAPEKVRREEALQEYARRLREEAEAVEEEIDAMRADDSEQEQ